MELIRRRTWSRKLYCELVAVAKVPPHHQTGPMLGKEGKEGDEGDTFAQSEMPSRENRGVKLWPASQIWSTVSLYLACEANTESLLELLAHR